jgi:hypothetical protein
MRKLLLFVDAVINLLLGILLLIFSNEIVTTLGVPSSSQAFYPNILGAILFGIGIALLIDFFKGSSGLGLLGAISINLCGGIVLAAWLIFGSLNLPLHGQIFLWILVFILVGISTVELMAQARRHQ